MAENLRIFGTNFNSINALKVTSQASGNPQLIYTTGDQILLQSKTVTPGSSQQEVLADEGYFGLSQVIVNAIPNSYIIPTGSYSITRNGEYNITNYATVNVNVPPNNQNKTVTPTTSQQSITADSGYTGLGTVTINAAPTQTKTVTPTTSAQTVTFDSGYTGLSSVTVNAAPTQTKSITPTKSTQTVNFDNGYVGLSSVTVNPIPDNYIDTTDANATTSDIIYGRTAYVNTTKITGSLVTYQVYEGAGAPSNNMGNIGDIYLEIG